MKIVSYLICLLISTLVACGEPVVIAEWSFEDAGDLDGWGRPNHVSELRVEEGAMKGRIMDWDPFVVAPRFEIAATPWQRVELKLKTDCGGNGQLFWSNTTETEYGGFSPEKHTNFEVIGDGKWHEYRVYPFWHTEGRIILLRLDLPKPPEAAAGERTFAVDYVRIVDLGKPSSAGTDGNWEFKEGLSGWEAAKGARVRAADDGIRFESGESPSARITSPPLRCPVEGKFWLHVQMRVDKGKSGYVRWVSSEYSNMHSAKFPIRGDGQMHAYNIDMADHRQWSGDLLLLELQPTNSADASALIRRIAVSPEPLGPAELRCRYLGLENAVNRTGRRLPLIFNVINRGGEVAEGLRIARMTLPEGVEVAAPDNWRELPNVAPFEPVTHRMYVTSAKPTGGPVEALITNPDGIAEKVEGTMQITQSPDLPQAEYVPEPQPVESDYEVGAFYFPGWPSMAKWDPVRRNAPERKPVLGWYDEGNPECVDWQIKWAVEHGIQFFMVDWYWSAGSRHLEHWVNAYKEARYRSYLKWCMMWANHNAPNTHSAEDQREVTRYWIENYFGMPEYYRIDGKPVVIIWSVGNMDRDMKGKGGAARLLEISRQMAREAGYKGIYFVAMKWPEASTDPAIIEGLADKGFDMTSIYHYMHHGGMAEDPRHFPFELVAESSYDHWKSWHEADIIPFLPNLSTGWDARPWHGDEARVIYGRTPELFRRICRDARRFADETGVKRLAVAPLNEWGEGSYIEPCKEFGFEMYDALRDVFCKEPAEGWPANIAPVDVGLGPYDLPEPKRETVTHWDFSDGSQGWGPFMGVRSFRAEDGAISFETTSRDPAIGATVHNVPAEQYPTVRIRMKIDSAGEDEEGQLFWETTTAKISEATSCHFDLIGDGEYHDYVLPVGENARWRGKIRRFRLDPCSHSGAQVAITDIQLNKE